MVVSQDLKRVVVSQDLKRVVVSQDLKKVVVPHEFKRVFHMTKRVVVSHDFKRVFVSQNAEINKQLAAEKRAVEDKEQVIKVSGQHSLGGWSA